MSKKEKLVVEHFVVIDVKQLDDLILENNKLKQQLVDSKTWKRACELACDVILRFTDGCPCKADYFYQQAKKEK